MSIPGQRGTRPAPSDEGATVAPVGGAPRAAEAIRDGPRSWSRPARRRVATGATARRGGRSDRPALRRPPEQPRPDERQRREEQSERRARQQRDRVGERPDVEPRRRPGVERRDDHPAGAARPGDQQHVVRPGRRRRPHNRDGDHAPRGGYVR